MKAGVKVSRRYFGQKVYRILEGAKESGVEGGWGLLFVSG